MASPIDLTSLANVQSYLGAAASVSGTSTLISSLITRTSRQCMKFTNRNFISGNYVDTYTGTGSHDLILRNYPIIEVSGISIFGQAITQSNNSGYITGWNNDDIQVHLTDRVFPKAFNSVQVNYSAGYTDTGYNGCPEDIEESIIEYVSILVNKTSRIGIVSSTKSEIGTDSYINDRDGVPASIKNVWLNYRKQYTY